MIDTNLGKMRHDWLREALNLRYPLFEGSNTKLTRKNRNTREGNVRESGYMLKCIIPYC